MKRSELWEKGVTYKKEIVPKRNDGMWLKVTYYIGKEIAQEDFYNLSNSPELLSSLVEKNRLNIEQNLLILN
jgi:hypothetical protein